MRWIDYDELELAERISESITATVFSGEYNGQEVAVKVFNQEMINKQKLLQEFEIIRLFGQSPPNNTLPSLF